MTESFIHTGKVQKLGQGRKNKGSLMGATCMNELQVVGGSSGQWTIKRGKDF